MLTRETLVALIFAGLYACTEECVVEACDDAKRSQGKGSLETGIVGIAAYRTDACENDCCECEYTEAALKIFAVDRAVESAADAQARLSQAAPLREVFIKMRYAEELPAGRYALCDSQLRTCANVLIAEGEVFTVNVQAVFGPMQMRVFDDRGQRHEELVVGDGAGF